MKSFVISIKEVNLTDDFQPIEEKKFQISVMENAYLDNAYLSELLERKWSDLKDYFLTKGKDVPFNKIRRDYE